MKLKNFWKRFWTMNVHNHEGFTLVELIIVIAILAILSSVAVVGYSSYVEKANKQADMTLVTEVANALQLAFYDNFANATADYVILSANGEAKAGSSFAENAMVAAYGDTWKGQLKLKWNGWQSSGSAVGEDFLGSSFDGKEEELMELVDSLSGTMKEYLLNTNDYGSEFGSYLEENGIDKGSVGAGNAAVIYVAEAIQKADQEKIVTILSGISHKYAMELTVDVTTTPDQYVNDAVVALAGEVNGSTLVTAAILYAYAEAYCKYSGKTIELDFAAIQSGEAGVNEVKAAFIDVMTIDLTKPEEIAKGTAYSGLIEGSTEQDPTALAIQDARAVLATLSAVNNAKDTFIDEIHTEGLYSSKLNFVQSYLDAAANMSKGDILIMIDENGKILIDPAM